MKKRVVLLCISYLSFALWTFADECLDGYIFQRLDYILSLKAEDSVNSPLSPYTFTDYQWYKDGEAIIGANRSYLYVKEGLDANTEYVLQMRHLPTGTLVQTCAFKPKTSILPIDTIYMYPSLYHNGDILTIKNDNISYIYFYYNGVEVKRISIDDYDYIHTYTFSDLPSGVLSVRFEMWDSRVFTTKIIVY